MLAERYVFNGVDCSVHMGSTGCSVQNQDRRIRLDAMSVAISIQSSISHTDVKALPDGYVYVSAVAEVKISANKQAQLKNNIKSPHRSKLFNIQEIALHVLLKNEIKPPSCSIS